MIERSLDTEADQPVGWYHPGGNPHLSLIQETVFSPFAFNIIPKTLEVGNMMLFSLSETAVDINTQILVRYSLIHTGRSYKSAKRIAGSFHVSVDRR